MKRGKTAASSQDGTLSETLDELVDALEEDGQLLEVLRERFQDLPLPTSMKAADDKVGAFVTL